MYCYSTGCKTFRRAGVGVAAPVLSDATADFTPSGEKRGSLKTTYHSALKNSDIQTDSSGAVSASVQFDAFGNVLSGSGTWKGQFGYAGKFGYQQDPDTGLKLLGHRYYDSDTGRFLTRDPAKDGRNWYSYCGNNPVTYIDDEGLQAKPKGGALHYMIQIFRAIADEAWDMLPELFLLAFGIELPEEIIELIKSVPRPKKMIINAGRVSKVSGLFNHIVAHIRKLVDNPNSRDAKKWKDEIKAALSNAYKKLSKGKSSVDNGNDLSHLADLTLRKRSFQTPIALKFR